MKLLNLDERIVNSIFSLAGELTQGKTLNPAMRKSLVLGWEVGRTLHFAVQQQVLPLVETALTRRRPWRPDGHRQKRRELLKATLELLERDADNFAKGLYPLELLRPESPVQHGRRFARIVRDALRVVERKTRRAHKEFSTTVEAKADRVPDYFRRNFHYQTDGYLSDESAELYDHQVDILFAGATDAMRRALLAGLVKYAQPDAKLLEIACGTGRLTSFVAKTVPNASITALDPSESYLAAARAQLVAHEGQIEFVQGFAEERWFEESQFDAVYSSYLFHELPEDVRRQAMLESIRAVKPGGLILILDSLQLGDRPEFDWALERFPIDFHEPFYRSYTNDKLEDWPSILSELELVEASTHLLSKLVVYRVSKKNQNR